MASGIDFPRNGLEQLRTIFGLGLNRNPMDVVFVSFDVEYLSRIQYDSYGKISQIGISMLDTRHFTSENPTGSLKTLHFVVGGHKRLVHTSRKFYFGTSEHVDESETSVNEAILKLLHIPDERSSDPKKYRNIVLVGHGLRCDLLILRYRGIIFEKIGTIIAKLDTTYIAKEVLGMNFRLRKLLQMLQCPDENCHNAGNDANFTLRALLMLAYYGLRPYASSPEAIRILNSFKVLGLDPLPDVSERNAKIRASRVPCEDYTLHALDIGCISFSEDSEEF